jgi:hypothetical protein
MTTKPDRRCKMDAMIVNRRAPRISVQRRNATSLVEGQLGTGVLMAPDVVLVPSEAIPAIIEVGGLVEVVLGPAAFATDGGSPLDAVVERRGVTVVEVLGYEEMEAAYAEGDVARLTLVAPSAYLPAWALEPPSRRAEQGERFLERIDAGADLWGGLEAAGVLPAESRELPSTAWLTDAEQNLRASFTPRIPDRVPLERNRGFNIACCLCPWCCKC